MIDMSIEHRTSRYLAKCMHMIGRRRRKTDGAGFRLSENISIPNEPFYFHSWIITKNHSFRYRMNEVQMNDCFDLSLMSR